jgi:hypothetical protein
MPSGPSTAARTPFVLLVVLLLSGGLITLLLLNSSLSQGSFELSELKKKTTELTDEQQALQRDVDRHSAPDALERRARELGMVPGGGPAFLGPDGKVLGVPRKATAEPLPPPPPAQPSGTAAGGIHRDAGALRTARRSRGSRPVRPYVPAAEPDDPRQVTQCPPRNHRGAGCQAPPGGPPRKPPSAQDSGPDSGPPLAGRAPAGARRPGAYGSAIRAPG